MKTLSGAKKLAIFSLTFATVSCGVKAKDRYDDKVFNKDQETKEKAEPEPEATEQETEEKEEKEVTEPVKEPPIEETKEEVEESPVTADTLVLHQRYRSYFDPESALRLINGRPANEKFFIAEKTIKKKLADGALQDGVTVAQTYGDGVSRALGKQNVVNTIGDREVADDATKASESGVQSYWRVTGADCPPSFICIDRLMFEPIKGAAYTMCFYRLDNGQPTHIPYAVTPNLKLEEFLPHLGKFGPYRGKRFAGKDIDCATATGEKQNEVFTVEVSKGSNQATQKLQNLKSDYEIALTYRRVDKDNQAPYLDETLRLQLNTSYFINSERKAVVRMIKTIRKAAELPSLLGLITPMDGLQVNLYLELCEDKLQNQVFCQ